MGADSMEWQRILTYTNFGRRRVIHVHDKERTGQHRGKPLLTSIMPMFKMLDHYERSELQAAVVNAMIAAFIETPMDGESIAEVFGGSSDDYLAARNEWDIKLQGGSIIPMFPGDNRARAHKCRDVLACPSSQNATASEFSTTSRKME